MSGLTEERKRQIRAEEHARAEREEQARREQEEKYRAEVRREEEYRAEVLREEDDRAEVRREEDYRAEVRRDIERDTDIQGDIERDRAVETAPTWAPPTPPEPPPTWTPPPPEPLATWTPPVTPAPTWSMTLTPAPTWSASTNAPTWIPPTSQQLASPRATEARVPPARSGRIYKLGGLLILLGLLVTVLSLWISPSGGKTNDDVLVASGDGDLAPAEPTWDPAALAYDDIYLRDGRATVVPDDGITTLAELETPSGSVEAATATPPAPPLGPSDARNIDALVDLVPADATIVMTLELPQLQRSPALTSLVTRILAQTPIGDMFTKTLQAGGGNLANGRAVLLAGMPKVGSEPKTLMAFRGPFDTAAVAAHLTSQGAVSSTVGTDTLLTFPHTVVVLRDDMIVFGAPAVIESARAALGAAVNTGPLSEPIAQMKASPAGYAVVRPNAALRKQLGGITPDLASATWVALGIDTTDGVVFTARVAFSSAAVAARAAAHLEASKAMLRVPNARFTSNGQILEMVMPIDEAALAGLVVTRAQA